MGCTLVGQVSRAIAEIDCKMINTPWSKAIRFVAARQEMREHFADVKSGKATPDECLILDTLYYLPRDCELAVRKAFAPYIRFVACPHCGGDGISRGTDYGMGCGVCHGRREVSEQAAEDVYEHRRALAKRGRHSRV